MRKMSKEDLALQEIWETAMTMLESHPDLSAYSPDHWEIAIKGYKMELVQAYDVEFIEESEEDE